MARRGVTRLLWALPFVACLAAALPAWQVAGRLGATSEAPSATGESDLADADASELAERVEAAADAAQASSERTFLDDLQEGASGALQGTDGGSEPAPAHGDGSADIAVSWSDETGLVHQATCIVEAYRDHTDARIATSGYLDMKGNVWGAVMRDVAWVDVVVVRANADGASSTAQVVRLHPAEVEGG